VTATTTEIHAPRHVVFDALVDPTTYPSWLVGAQTIRGVDDAWPEEGTSFRHVIGVPPLLVPGSTTSMLVVPGRRLDLRAGMGPFGAAAVSFQLTDTATGGTRVEVDERFVAGPGGVRLAVGAARGQRARLGSQRDVAGGARRPGGAPGPLVTPVAEVRTGSACRSL
jgi:uncharacterized protein YndB with AHSA1/START domain